MISKAQNSADTSTKKIADAVCTGCGCVCDDIELQTNGLRIVEAANACELGRAWFFAQRDPNEPACRIEGQPSELSDGLDRAARILADARYPLVYGLSGCACEAQAAAASLADRLGANLDTTTSIGHGPTVLAMQSAGEVTCTLGEVRHRADLVVFWGCNPADNDPRHFERYSLFPPGMFVPNGRAGRTCVVIDVRRTATAKVADHFFQIRPGSDFEAFWILLALLKGIPLEERAAECTGIELGRWQDLIDRMRSAQFGIFLYGMGLTMTEGKHLNVEALMALTRDLNDYTRFACRSMRAAGNVTGGDNVVSWRTGYPYGVSLSRGYPRYNPGEYTANDVLARREADAALIVGADPLSTLSGAACDHLRSIPSVVIDSTSTPASQAATVEFRSATYGIHTPGTVYRMDDVPLALRPALPSTHPSDLELIQAIEQRVIAIHQSARSQSAPGSTTGGRSGQGA